VLKEGLVELTIIPAEGTSLIRFGMNADDVAAIAASLSAAVDRNADGPMRLYGGALGTDVFVYFDADNEVNSIDVWRPEDPRDGLRVRLGEVDVFTEEAPAALNRLRATAELDDEDVYFPRAVIGNAVVGFNREGGEFIDEDADDGLSVYFNAVSVSVTPG
jgi:hypothetical protein